MLNEVIIIESLSKRIYDFMERLLLNPKYRSILVSDNLVLNYLLLAHHEALCHEMKQRYGDKYE